MKKKILALCLVVVLAVTAVTGATLAYFTDDEQVTNTMVVGNVQINIEELAYVDDEFKPFEDDKFTLYPIDNEKGQVSWNKMVYTFNTSPSEDDAYIRTIILFECNDEIDDGIVSLRYVNDPGSKVVAENIKVQIGEEKYNAVVFVAADEKPIAFDKSLNSLTSVWMDQNVTSEQIKGWGTDGKVDIKVLSQAIQATGLTHEQAMTELGEINEANLIKWFTGEDKAEEGVVNDYHVFKKYNSTADGE